MKRNGIHSNPAFGGPWVQQVERRAKIKTLLATLKSAIDVCQEHPPTPETFSALTDLKNMGYGPLARRFSEALSSPYPEVRIVHSTAAFVEIEKRLNGGKR